MMKLANPLYYPVAVLAGGIVLVVGVRLAQLPSKLILPVAAGIATAGASFLQYREPQDFELDNSELEQEITAVQIAAFSLANQANKLRLEAKKLLTDSSQGELLASLQMNCDRAVELPEKLRTIVWYLYGSNSLISVSSLKQQLVAVQQQRRSSSGLKKQQFNQLKDFLRHNIKLAKAGKDTRLARITRISSLIQDSTAVFYNLQTKLRSFDFNNSEQMYELQLLSEQMSSLEVSLDVLVRK
ncbi:hypothetical protein IQ243_24280 [Nostocales cyanobacterium LEGE 11386]|nr:hypothetical protein [Nostocales cyanobacterium LEGE 11386]